jgi:hypothetical protein
MILIFYPSRISDPGVEKAPEPGSATLCFTNKGNASTKNMYKKKISYVSDVLPRYFTSGDLAAEFGGVPGTADGQAAALSLQHAHFTPGTLQGKNTGNTF